MRPTLSADMLRLFDQQLACIESNDRDAQLALYSDDLTYEFPFAVDRPRLIQGREAFAAIMQPMWKAAQASGLQARVGARELYATEDPDMAVARFTLEIETQSELRSLEFVQFLQVREGRIQSVVEYFDPLQRAIISDARPRRV
jgi:ketosteroid isomerase-like protein